MLSLFFGGFFIPMTIILFFYSRILVLMHSRLNELSNFKSQENSNSPGNTLDNKSASKELVIEEQEEEEKLNKSTNNGPVVIDLKKNGYQSVRCSQVLTRKSIYCARLVRSELKLTKCIFLSVFFFCITWLPYAIMALYLQFSSDRDSGRFVTPYISSMPILLSKTSAILNPLIFTLNDPKFKTFFENRIILKQQYLLTSAMAKEIDRNIQNTTDQDSRKKRVQSTSSQKESLKTRKFESKM